MLNTAHLFIHIAINLFVYICMYEPLLLIIRGVCNLIYQMNTSDLFLCKFLREKTLEMFLHGYHAYMVR